MSVEAPNSDADLLDLIRIAGPLSVTELADAMEVTATAVRQRLTRLMGQSMIQREAIRAGRGRPKHRYSLTDKGLRANGLELHRSGPDPVAGNSQHRRRKPRPRRVAADFAGPGLGLCRANPGQHAARKDSSRWPNCSTSGGSPSPSARRPPTSPPLRPMPALSESGRRGQKHLPDGENDVLRTHRQRIGIDAMPAQRRRRLPIRNRFVKRQEDGAGSCELRSGCANASSTRSRLLPGHPALSMHRKDRRGNAGSCSSSFTRPSSHVTPPLPRNQERMHDSALD